MLGARPVELDAISDRRSDLDALATRCHSTVVLQFAQAAAGPGSRQGAPLPVQSVLEVPPALAEPAAALVGAALLGLLTIARQSADRLFEPPLGLLARAFRSLLASASGHVGLLD